MFIAGIISGNKAIMRMQAALAVWPEGKDLNSSAAIPKGSKVSFRLDPATHHGVK